MAMWLELGSGAGGGEEWGGLRDLVLKQLFHRKHFLFLTVCLFGVTLGDMIEIIGI